MRISNISNNVILKHCNVYEEDEDLIEVYKESAKSYIKNYTGLDDEGINKYEELTLAFLNIISDMYDNRSLTVENNKENKMLDSIMFMHSINLL